MMNAPSEHSPATTAVAQGTTAFHGVRFLVADVKRACDFYTTQLGFNLSINNFRRSRRSTGAAKDPSEWPGRIGIATFAGRRAAESRRLEPRRSSSERPARNHRSTAQRRSGVSEHHGNRTSRQADSGPRSRRQSSRAFRAGASGMNAAAALTGR